MAASSGRSVIILFLVLVSGSPLFSQTYIKGVIVDRNSKFPIAFASVAYQNDGVLKGVISDIHGSFGIPDRDVESIRVSCVGYQTRRLIFTPDMKLSELIVELSADTLSISEVRITPDMNPALRIIRNVLRNKEKNNHENYDKYRYRCYLKTTLNLKLSYNDSATDSATIRKNRDLNKHARFISESVVESSTVNRRTGNKVIAVRTSGFENPLLGQYFVSVFHNSISFYNNNISLFAVAVGGDMTSTEYLSPLSDECLRSYNYLLEETFESAEDTVYVIEFHPKKSANFNGLKGRLYINSNGWAIKNIVTEPFEKGLINFRFRQDYEFTGGRWFPSALDEEIGFVSMKVSKKIQAVPVYLITSRISDVSYDPEITIDSINYEKVYLDEDMIRSSREILDTSRPDSLTAVERNTYQFMDSIGGKYHLDMWAELYPSFMVGKIPIKMIDINLEELFRNNDFEGMRIGLGISTNDKFSKFVSLWGFAGLGIKDREFKYGAGATFNIYPENDAELSFSYQRNVREPGADMRNDFTLLSYNEYLRDYLACRMDYFTEKSAGFNFRLSRYLKIRSSVSIRDIMPGYDYLYRDVLITDFQADELKVSANFAYGEEIHMFGNQDVVFFAGNPVINLTWKRGIDLFNRDSYNYNRYEASIDVTTYKGRLGQTDLRIAGGYIDQPLPYSLLFTGEGSKSSYPVLINNTFQTMKPYEFLSDRYLNIFFTHNFGSLLLETPVFKPKFIVVHNSGWGSLRNPSDHMIDFKVKDKIYLESGLLINNIIRFKIFNLYYIGFGGGGFYRYGYYGYDRVFDNIALKFSLTIALE